MSTSSQFYTGADPSYFPAQDPKKKSFLRRLGRALAGPVTMSLIVSILATVIGVRLLWQTTEPIPVREESPALKQRTSSAVRLPATTRESEVKAGSHRPKQAAGAESERAAFRTAPLQLPANPQLQKMILDNPPLLAPFPTEHNVTIGTPRARLVGAFGKPDLRARTTQQQRVIDTYIYEQQDRATIVQMQDGSVVSAHTGPPEQVRVLSSESEP
jgi:hypothetical protein